MSANTTRHTSKHPGRTLGVIALLVAGSAWLVENTSGALDVAFKVLA